MIFRWIFRVFFLIIFRINTYAILFDFVDFIQIRTISSGHLELRFSNVREHCQYFFFYIGPTINQFFITSQSNTIQLMCVNSLIFELSFVLRSVDGTSFQRRYIIIYCRGQYRNIRTETNRCEGKQKIFGFKFKEFENGQ